MDGLSQCFRCVKSYNGNRWNSFKCLGRERLFFLWVFWLIPFIIWISFCALVFVILPLDSTLVHSFLPFKFYLYHALLLLRNYWHHIVVFQPLPHVHMDQTQIWLASAWCHLDVSTLWLCRVFLVSNLKLWDQVPWPYWPYHKIHRVFFRNWLQSSHSHSDNQRKRKTEHWLAPWGLTVSFWICLRS